MKLLSISMDDEEMPESVMVEMSIAEAAAILRVFGNLNSCGQDRLGVRGNTIYDCLAGSVFNCYWKDGVNDVLPKIDLATINDNTSTG